MDESVYTTETLAEAKQRLQANLKKGIKCPCCNRWIKIYERQVNAAMVSSLIEFDLKELLG